MLFSFFSQEKIHSYLWIRVPQLRQRIIFNFTTFWLLISVYIQEVLNLNEKTESNIIFLYEYKRIVKYFNIAVIFLLQNSYINVE